MSQSKPGTLLRELALLPVLLLLLAASGVLFTPTRAAADQCKPAAPLPQSKCNKDAQCCAGLVCQAGRCQGACHIGSAFYASGAANPANACQSCQPAVSKTAWTNKTNGSPCSDGNTCTQTDTCQAGTCVGGNAVTCTALDQCHTAGTCNPSTGACSNPSKADGTSCDDGNPCTQTDACQAGSCGGNPVVCTALDSCHTVGTCNPSTGVCSNPTKGDGSACNDGNGCTQVDTCTGGICVGANPVVCTALDQCHTVGTCDPATGVCSNPTASSGTTCDDGNDCTYNDACNSSGVCAGTAISCTSDQCNDRQCNGTSSCTVTRVPDGTTCNNPASGSTVNVCTVGTCQGCLPAGTCVPTGCAPDDEFCPAVACAFNQDCPAPLTCSPGAAPSPRFVDNDDGTITDRKTCLVWEKKDGSDSTADGTNPHDVDNKYSWTLAGGDVTLPTGTAFTSFLASLNGGTGFTGHTDWRLPASSGLNGSTGQRGELESILDPSAPTCGPSGACINAIFGSTAPAEYWSFSSDNATPPAAYGVLFFGPPPVPETNTPKTLSESVRAVRGGPRPPG